MRICFPLAAALLLRVSLYAAAPIMIRNATVLTVTKGTIANGSVLVRDGKIAEVGTNLKVPADATVIDASGQFLMPGIIDCHTHTVSESMNEGTVSVSSMVGVGDVLNPEDIAIYRALAGGVTTANVLHGSANAIGGKCVVIKMRWGKSASELLFEGAMPGIKFALGENPKRRGQTATGVPSPVTPPRYPATRMGVESVIREAFNEAKAYQASWKDYEAKKSRGEIAIPPARDLKLEPLVEVLEDKRLVHVHCYRQDEILMILHVADDYGFHVQTLQHGLEGYKVAKEIAAHGTGVSTFTDFWGFKMEAFDAIPYNPALMTRKGVLVSVNSDSAELMRHLNTEAAKTMKYGGMTETEAISMITINPAKQLRIEKRVGSVEVGKDADMVIYDEHPLSTFAKVTKVLIDGQVYFDRDKDLAERPEKITLKQTLITKAAEEKKKSATQGVSRRPGE